MAFSLLLLNIIDLFHEQNHLRLCIAVKDWAGPVWKCIQGIKQKE